MEIRNYKAADGVAMLERQPGGLKGYPDAEKWCKEAEQDGLAFTVVYEGKMVLCAGIVREREGVGLAWALYPTDVGNYHIDPRIAKDRLRGLMVEHNFRRVQATVRADFPAGAGYLRYLGFKREGRMEQNEPDGTDSFLYAIVRDKCLRCGKCCHFFFYGKEGITTRTSTKCPNLTKDNLCSVYNHRPDWCMSARQMAELRLLPEGCGYRR